MTLPLGDITSGQLRAAADLATAYGDGGARVTHEQDLVFRWVREKEVPEFYRRLVAAGLGLADAGTVADVTSCPGAESCRMAVTQSRGLGRLLGDHLRARPDLVDAASDLKIKISGCPNGCGQHHIAGIGFQGSVRKLGDKVVPQYFVMVGGAVDDAEPTSRGWRRRSRPGGCPWPWSGCWSSTARSGAKEKRRPRSSAAGRRGGQGRLADLEALTAGGREADDYVDLGEDTQFKVEMLEGECSA